MLLLQLLLMLLTLLPLLPLGEDGCTQWVVVLATPPSPFPDSLLE
jgi:hypothetical protein